MSCSSLRPPSNPPYSRQEPNWYSLKIGTGSTHKGAKDTQSCSKVEVNEDSLPQPGSWAPSGERWKPWSGAQFGQAGGRGWPRACNICSPLRNQLQAFQEARGLSLCCLLPVMIYSIKLCLKISSAGGLFSAELGCGRSQRKASSQSSEAGRLDTDQPGLQIETLRLRK